MQSRTGQVPGFLYFSHDHNIHYTIVYCVPSSSHIPHLVRRRPVSSPREPLNRITPALGVPSQITKRKKRKTSSVRVVDECTRRRSDQKKKTARDHLPVRFYMTIHIVLAFFEPISVQFRTWATRRRRSRNDVLLVRW